MLSCRNIRRLLVIHWTPPAVSVARVRDDFASRWRYILAHDDRYDSR